MQMDLGMPEATARVKGDGPASRTAFAPAFASVPGTRIGRPSRGRPRRHPLSFSEVVSDSFHRLDQRLPRSFAACQEMRLDSLASGGEVNLAAGQATGRDVNPGLGHATAGRHQDALVRSDSKRRPHIRRAPAFKRRLRTEPLRQAGDISREPVIAARVSAPRSG
jgi:hypothetical protein